MTSQPSQPSTTSPTNTLVRPVCKSNASRISVSAAIPRLASTTKYGSSTFHGQLFRKVRRSSARILFRMSYFLRKEVRGRIKRKRRMVQKERKWLSRITWSLTTYYGTLFRKRRGPARWLKKQFAALRRVLSGKFHAYESRFESRLDYWLYKLHFTRRLSHSIILLKAGHIRLNGVVEKRFDHILRPLDVITFSPKVSRWYRRCFHGTTRQNTSRQLRHPRKKLNVAFYLNSRRFVQQRKALNIFNRKRHRQNDIANSRKIRYRQLHTRARRRTHRLLTRRPRGHATRLMHLRKRQLLLTQTSAFLPNGSSPKMWGTRTPRLRRVISAFRQLSYKIRHALKQRNAALQTRPKTLLPVYQMAQLKQALRPMRSQQSDLDLAAPQPLDYFLLNELDDLYPHPGTESSNSADFVSSFLAADSAERPQVLTAHFPQLQHLATELSPAQLDRLSLLCTATSHAQFITSDDTDSIASADRIYDQLYQHILRVLQGQAPSVHLSSNTHEVKLKKNTRQRLINRKKFSQLSYKELRRRFLASSRRLHPERRLRRRQLRRLTRKARRLHRVEDHKLLTFAQDSAPNTQDFSTSHYSVGSRTKKGRPASSMSDFRCPQSSTRRITGTTHRELLRIASTTLPVSRLVNRLASYKANKMQSDTIVHQLTQAALAQGRMQHPLRRLRPRTFIMTFTSRGKILRGLPRNTGVDYTQRRQLHANQRLTRPTITQAARVLSSSLSVQPLSKASARQDVFQVFDYLNSNSNPVALSENLRIQFFRTRAQYQPCWKTAAHYNILSGVPTVPTVTQTPRAIQPVITNNRLDRFKVERHKFRKLFTRHAKPWDISPLVRNQKPQDYDTVFTQTHRQVGELLKSPATTNTIFEMNARYSPLYWERNLPHYKRIHSPLRYKTLAYKRFKQRQQLTSSFRSRIARWANKKKYRTLQKYTPNYLKSRRLLQTRNHRSTVFAPHGVAVRAAMTAAQAARYYLHDFIEWAERRRVRLAVKTEYNPLQYNPEELLIGYYRHAHSNQLRHRRFMEQFPSSAQFVSALLVDATLALQSVFGRRAQNTGTGSAIGTVSQLEDLYAPLTTPTLLGEFDNDKSLTLSLIAGGAQAARDSRARLISPVSFKLLKTKPRLRNLFQPSGALRLQSVRWLPTPQARHRFRSTDQWPTPIPYYRWTYQPRRIRRKATFSYNSYFMRNAAGLTKYLRSRQSSSRVPQTAVVFTPTLSYSLPPLALFTPQVTDVLSTTHQFASSICNVLDSPSTITPFSLLGSLYTILSMKAAVSAHPSLNSTLLMSQLMTLGLGSPELNAVLYSTTQRTHGFRWATVHTLTRNEASSGHIYNFAHLKLFSNLLQRITRAAGVKPHRRNRRILRRTLSQARRFGYRARQQMRNSVVSFYYARKHFSFINRMHILAPRAHVANEVHLPTYAHVVTWRRSENTPTGTRRHGTALTKQRIYAFIRRFKHLM